jgi:salicylate hydroxylase
MSSDPVLIAGAGIGGLVLAHALALAGVPVVLAERRAGFSEVGAGLQLSPNATSVLARLGLAASVARHATEPQHLEIRRWGNATVLAGMPMQQKPMADAAPFWCLRRADLQTALLDAVRLLPGMRLLVGRELTGFSQDADGVSVTLRTGRGLDETIRASVLVGADGLRSSVRALAGDKAAPRFLGYEAWRTLVPSAAAPEMARHPAVRLWLGPAGHAVHYPVASGEFINLVVIRNGEDTSTSWNREGDPRLLSGMIASAAPGLAALARAAQGWQVWSLFDRPPAAMAKGRVCLIGDAAHPVLPFLAQGAGLAIEDAGMLAARLPSALVSPEPGEVSRALAGFAAARRARVTRVQEAGRSNGRMYHAGFPLALARDLVLRQLGESGLRRRYDWLYGWRLPE